ncbi:MAG: hypothetical protein SFU98_22850 [Leptospiraceae bacterium]|nr:hypothetical protein [Leptospiraceae bacterium]
MVKNKFLLIILLNILFFGCKLNTFKTNEIIQGSYFELREYYGDFFRFTSVSGNKNAINIILKQRLLEENFEKVNQILETKDETFTWTILQIYSENDLTDSFQEHFFLNENNNNIPFQYFHEEAVLNRNGTISEGPASDPPKQIHLTAKRFSMNGTVSNPFEVIEKTIVIFNQDLYDNQINNVKIITPNEKIIFLKL